MKIPLTALCLDVSLCNTGWAVWRPDLQRFAKTGCIVTSPTPKRKRTFLAIEDNVRRYQELAEDLRNIMNRFNCFWVFAELPHGGAQNQKAATAMAAASAVVTTTIFLQGIGFYVIQPNEIKRLVSSDRKVSKEDIIRLICRKFGNKLIPDNAKAEHVADAMACILVARRRFPDRV
jgi:Holliday junction resolvasome RuvABC endonuclease subunit